MAQYITIDNAHEYYKNCFNIISVTPPLLRNPNAYYEQSPYIPAYYSYGNILHEHNYTSWFIFKNYSHNSGPRYYHSQCSMSHINCPHVCQRFWHLLLCSCPNGST